jgi:hypothetical protein
MNQQESTSDWSDEEILIFLNFEQEEKHNLPIYWSYDGNDNGRLIVFKDSYLKKMNPIWLKIFWWWKIKLIQWWFI